MDQELIAYLDKRFREVNERVDSRFDQVEETIRHTRIEIEGLRGDIRQVAEGVAGVTEQLESFKKEVGRSHSDLDRRLYTIERLGKRSSPPLT